GRQVAEEDVLDHVEAQELLLPEGVERRRERDEEERHARAERPDAPSRRSGAAAAKRADAPRVEAGNGGERDELQRLERPARQERRPGVHRLQSRVGLVTAAFGGSIVSAGLAAGFAGGVAPSETRVRLFHYHLVTSKVRQAEARYLGKLGFELVARYGRIG